MELLTAARMRAIETEAIESGRVTGLDLMERAGQEVVEAVFGEWPELAQGPRRAVVLCGPGNNGGDGFVIARLLHDRGWEVKPFLFGDPGRLPADARTNWERWSECAGREPACHTDLLTSLEAGPRGCDLFIDAGFGTGLARALPEGMAAIAASLKRREPGQLRHVAVDVPSGLCADSGRVLGAESDRVFHCDLTVTFHRPKCGHHLAEGPRACGMLIVRDIGLPKSPAQTGSRQRQPDMTTREITEADLPDLAKSGAHKYDHGHALIISGGPGKTGAARLAARGALRIGAGLVTLACPVRALPEAAAQVTAIMLAGLDGPSGLAEILEDDRLGAICLGPGLGLGQVTAELVRVALETGRSCVLDADALSRFQRTPAALFGMLHENCVLTPHGGEFARLFPDIAEKLKAPADAGPAYSKIDATREAAARAGCVVLFKGSDTVIAAPDGASSVSSPAGGRAVPWLATAGTGDVLAGFITGLLARGFQPAQAAEAAVWLHVECARRFGPGLIAEDLPEELPNVLAALERPG